MAATSPSCLPTTSFWSPSSASPAKMPVSAEPGFVKRYSTPASFRVWISNIPPVPVMVFRMVDLVVRVHVFAGRGRGATAASGGALARDGQALAAVVVLVDPGASLDEARRTERREIEGPGRPEQDPLGQASADGRGRLERRARVPQHDKQPGYRRDLVDDRATVRAHHD